MRRAAPSRIAWLWCAVLVAAACGAPPRPPPEREPEIVLRTEAHDERAGEQAAGHVDAELGLLSDAGLEAFVAEVGGRLARHAPRTGFTYRFQVVDQDAPNAFALPGGYIYVSRGLLVLTNDEAELAGVLGHEIVHVAMRHASARQSVATALPGFFRFATIGQLASYSREQEREADRIGQGLAGVAGYDPDGLTRFLTNLEYTERLRLGFSRMTGFFDTHPATAERVAEAGARARGIAWKAQPAVSGDHPGYLARLDGLVIGTAATEGVIARGGRFLHPELGFALRFPESWEVINTRQAVGAIAPQHDAQVALEFHGPGDDPKLAAEEFLASDLGQPVRETALQTVRIGELEAVRVLGSAASPAAPVSVHLTFIAREGTIYRLTGVALGSRNRLEGVFNNVARSFRPITPRERASIRETRVRLATSRADETLAELTQRTGNTWSVQETAVMNGVFATDRLPAGTQVKIAISQPYGAPAPR